MITVGSLFAGIGGIELGLERTGGFRTVWQVEIDDYARRVLAKHWPDVRRWDDVRTFPPEPVEAWRCDLVCGGFPCQDVSNAGRRAGIGGERSGLWSEFARVVRVLRPRFVLVENVAALLGRGAGRVLGDLAECGYDAEWDCLPAAALGALHIRNRVFLLAYPAGYPRGLGNRNGSANAQAPDPERPGRALGQGERGDPRPEQPPPQRSGLADVHDAFRRRHGTPQETVFAGRGGFEPSDWWASEPNVGRVADGVPARVDRLRCLGNAVVPQAAQWIGERILAALERN